MKKIAITGTMGSGKSTCSEILRELGWYVFDCDACSRAISQGDHPVKKAILKRFPKVMDSQGEINRSCLAALIFEDAQSRHDLEAILHPAIFKEMEEAMQKHTARLFFAEVPTLFESGWDQFFDAVLVISIENKQREERLMQSRALSLKEIQSRIQSQYSDAQKIEKATWVIENNGTLNELKEKLILWLKEIDQ